MVTLHTIDGGTVNAINDALLYDFIIGQNGIASGATVTSEGALLLHIDSGWGVIKGRIFSIEAETISATPSTSGTVKGRLILQIDITNTTSPVTFVTQAAATLPALQQEDINGNGTIFQLPIATYDVNEVAVSNLQMVAPVVETIKGRIDTAQSTATARGTLAQQALNATKWTELWVNNNIDTFNEQTIYNIDTRSYSWFIISYTLYKGNYIAITSFLAKKGPNISPLVPLGEPIDLSYRNVEINNSGVTFKNCYTFTPGLSQQYVRNERLIPIAILGIHSSN